MELPEGNAATQRVLANCKILDEIGYDVILLGVNKRKSLLRSTYSKIDNNEGLTCYSCNYPDSFLQLVWYTFSSCKVVNFLKNIDVNISAVILYNYPAIPMLKIANYCKRHNIKTFADSTEWFLNVKNPIKNIDTFLRMRYVHFKLDGLICISNYLANYYKKVYNVINIPSLVLRNDCNKYNYKPKKTRVFTYAGNVGNGNKDKLNLVIKCMAALNDSNIRFNIIGITEENLFKIYDDMLEFSNFISKHVKVYGYLPRSEVGKIISESDFTVFIREPNRQTNAGFPTKLAESYSFGTPVITTPTSNIEEYIVEGKNGFLAEDCSVPSILEALTKALKLSDQELMSMHDFCEKCNPLDYKKFSNYFEDLLEIKNES